ncbi:unnamed protein product [Macrosiphum euphorbiae]|uniref:Uncharacterized protein n=1 Tax=Macrosiphum euphorbiae TaxID=13131 RepID=A0AAV0XEE5_9HEMI|nr:unnamed protein product [Macrosiphum euphorbiae]
MESDSSVSEEFSFIFDWSILNKIDSWLFGSSSPSSISSHFAPLEVHNEKMQVLLIDVLIVLRVFTSSDSHDYYAFMQISMRSITGVIYHASQSHSSHFTSLQ